MEDEVLIRDLAEIVLERRGRRWKPSTLKVNRSIIRRRILPVLGDQDVRTLTRPDVERWMVLNAHVPHAANRSLPILSGMCHEAVLCGLIEENPCKGVRRCRVPLNSQKFLTESDMARLGRAIRFCRDAWPVRVGAIELVALTGMRQGEVRNLRWEDVHEDKIVLPDSKTGPRVIWLSSAARACLARLPSKGRFANVFPASRPGLARDHSSRPLASESLWRVWRSVRNLAGLSDVRIHDLRHTFVSLALSSGESLSMVSSLVGHRNINTTMRYGHASEDWLRDGVEAAGRSMT